MQDLKTGIELANRYTLVRKLGQGGAAETWLAQDRLTRASIALKILTSSRISKEDFRREWQTGIRLMHAHIVRVFEFHDDAEGQFYSLQFIEGTDVGVLAGAPLEHILPPMASIADALRYAHGKGVVHRDIKAGNILIDANGAVYLCDFGVAARSGDEGRGGSLIAASPQSLRGEPPQAADDIFALGGLLYELISGRSPYSSAHTAEDICSRVPDALVSAAAGAVPADISGLVGRMLDKEARNRPDAEQVINALEASGFPAGIVPQQYLASRATVTDQSITVSEGPRRSAVVSPAEIQVNTGKGLNARNVGVALSLLIAILIGVVFFLPDAVREDPMVAPVSEATVGRNPAPGAGSGRSVEFTENLEDLSNRDERVQSRSDTEVVLGELLSKMETLESRAVQRWGGLAYKQAQSFYAEGDSAYLARDYATATAKYREAIQVVEPLFDQADKVFADAYTSGREALDAADPAEALRFLELAAAVSPNHSGALAALNRARNLDTVLSLTNQGITYENELELQAARQSFEKASELDPDWEPASDGLQRVLVAINQREFDARMSEGLLALNAGELDVARAAFRMAEQLQPDSPDPGDGLLQVEQGLQLRRIAELEQRALVESQDERWEDAMNTYEGILEIDSNLEFAQAGVDEARRMIGLHEKLDDYIEDPDSLSMPATMARATSLVVDITRMPDIGPRLADRRDQLSQLLKRAATPLTVELVSDNNTDVSIYKVGKLGTFESRQLTLRPGTYVAVGSRPGYRDVRLEFRVAPEVDMEPVVIRCEEAI